MIIYHLAIQWDVVKYEQKAFKKLKYSVFIDWTRIIHQVSGSVACKIDPNFKFSKFFMFFPPLKKMDVIKSKVVNVFHSDGI